jgi:alpha-ketoglutarate-dependent taurine dioxygenase
MVTEELRDYRFYAQDMAHPSNWTTEYIYNVFKDNWFMDDAKELAVLGEKFARMSQHRPMTEDNALLEAWKTKLRQQRQEILTQFPAAYFPEI